MTDGAAPDSPSRIERASLTMARASAMLIGGTTGALIACVGSAFVPSIGPIPLILAGAALGGIAGLVWPARVPFAAKMAPGPTIVPGEPVPIMALGHVNVRELDGPTGRTLLVAGLLELAALPVLVAFQVALGQRVSVFLLGVVVTVGFTAVIAAIAFLPPFLVPERTRRATAVLFWTGARESRRALGSAQASVAFPTTPDEAPGWIARNPSTDATRAAHVELLTMIGDFDSARDEVERLPVGTPRERFVRAEQAALVRYQETGLVDYDAARAAAEAMPDGPDRTEALGTLALAEARRVLPDGDWRAPLLAVRDTIPESDLRIILRDYGLVSFIVMTQRVWPVILLLAVLTIVLGLLVGQPASTS